MSANDRPDDPLDGELDIPNLPSPEELAGGGPLPEMSLQTQKARGSGEGKGPVESSEPPPPPHPTQVSIKFTVSMKAGKKPTMLHVPFSGLRIRPKAEVTFGDEAPKEGFQLTKGFNPRGTLPIGLRILGATVGAHSDFTAHFAVKLLDANGKSIQTPHTVFSPGDGGSVAKKTDVGFPLHLLRQHAVSEGASSALEEAPDLLEDHKHYWHISMDDLEKGVTEFVDPTTGGQFKLIDKKNTAAKLLRYALSVKNKFSEDIMTDPNYQFNNNSAVLQV